MFATPSPRRGLHRLVVDRLGLRVVQGVLPTGSILPSEAELSQMLNVSRTVVREAIKVLASKGLIESRPKTGTRVLPRAHWNLIDEDVLTWQFTAGADLDFFRSIAEVRSIIEPRAAALAAARRTDEELAAMEEHLGRMASSVDDRPTYIGADLDLHAVILQAAHNELLTQMTGTLTVALRASRDVTTQVPGGMPTAIGVHSAVVEAIRQRAEERALDAMNELVKTAAHDVEKILSRAAAADQPSPTTAGRPQPQAALGP